MESELEKFRQRKQREEKKAEMKAKLQNTVDSWSRTLTNAILPNWNEDEGDDNEDDTDQDKSEPSTSSTQEARSKSKTGKLLMGLVTLLRFLAWVFVYIAFLKVGFGAVFFTISLICFIYWNTRKSRRRKKGEVSAYSVFNKDCQSIDGTLKAEHLEKQLLYRN